MKGILTAQFVSERGLISSAIRYLSDGRVSHVDLVLPNGDLLGSRSNGGVRVRRPDYGNFTYVKRVSVEVPNVSAGYDFAYAQIGKTYDFEAILDMFLHKERPLDNDPRKWFCSELNYCIVRAAGVELLEVQPEIVTPAEELMSPYWRLA